MDTSPFPEKEALRSKENFRGSRGKRERGLKGVHQRKRIPIHAKTGEGISLRGKGDSSSGGSTLSLENVRKNRPEGPSPEGGDLPEGKGLSSAL